VSFSDGAPLAHIPEPYRARFATGALRQKRAR
jgi:hypothetical protein